MGTTTVVAGVLAQLEEFLDVHVPSFKVRANRTFALAALIHRNSGIVYDFEERHYALRFAIGALDV